jgi:heme-degrading monooxygenase HmoA
MKPLLCAISASLLASGTLAQTATANPSFIATLPNAVVAIVKVPKPWYAPKSVVVSKMQATVPQYEQLAGLHYKIFTLTQADAQFGGIYLWKDRSSAQNWFNPAWYDRVEKERGHKADLRLFQAPIVVTNAPATPGANHVATLVTVTTPPQVGPERLVAEFTAAAPTYQKVPGLLRKYFIITDGGKFGGVYLWDTQTSAQNWFSPVWHERVRKTYGAAAQIEWLDAPIAIASKLADNQLEGTKP